MTPNTTMISLTETKANFQKQSYLQCVEDKYTINQLREYFGSEADKKISQFKSNCMVLFSDSTIAKTVETADKFSVIQGLINLSKDNLSINPYDKEACIVNFGGKVTAIAMCKGKIKRMQEKGAIKYIDLLEVVYVWDKILNVNNKYSFTKCLENDIPYKKIEINANVYYYAILKNEIAIKSSSYIRKEVIELLNKKDVIDEIKVSNEYRNFLIEKGKEIEFIIVNEKYIRNGVLLIAIMPDGRARHKLTMSKDIELRRAKAPAKAIWDTWTDEMYKKTCVNIFEKEIGVTTLTFSDYEQYDKEEETEQETETVETTHEVVVEPEVEKKASQDLMLRQTLENKIKENPTALKLNEIDQLYNVIDDLNDEKLLLWITAIDNRIKAKKEKDAPMI